MFYMKFRRQYIMSNIRFDYSKALPFVGQHEIDNMAEYVKEAHNNLQELKKRLKRFALIQMYLL